MKLTGESTGDLKIYLAGLESPEKIELAKKHDIPYWLVSLHTLEGKGARLDTIIQNKPEEAELFLDNGCFTIQNQMKEAREQSEQSEFDVIGFTEDYISLLKKNNRHQKIERYPVADPPFKEGEKQSRLALQMMEEEGLEPAPVWHLEWSMDYLKKLCRDHDFICLGGITSEGDTRQQKEAFLPILRYCKKRDTKTHIFGVTSAKFMKWFRELAYSADSTTWSYGGRARQIFMSGTGFDGYFSMRNINELTEDQERVLVANYDIDDYNMSVWKDIVMEYDGGGKQ
jgi:hypothetical protein